MARIDHLVTSGTFSLDGETFDVDNNVWIVGGAEQCVVIDPAHDASAVWKKVNGRQVLAIVLTHGHDDHIRQVQEFRQMVDAPVLLHPADRMLWDDVFPDEEPDGALAEGDVLRVAGVELRVLHTPGHTADSLSFLVDDLVVHRGGVAGALRTTPAAAPKRATTLVASTRYHTRSAHTTGAAGDAACQSSSAASSTS